MFPARQGFKPVKLLQSPIDLMLIFSLILMTVLQSLQTYFWAQWRFVENKTVK